MQSTSPATDGSLYRASSIDQVHMGTLEPYIRKRRKQGISSGTTRRDLAAVRRVLNQAARLWRDEHGLSWLETQPLIQLLKNLDAQRLLFPLLPAYLQRMALFKVNTGCREQEVCGLRWDWEVKVPEMETSVFIIPDVQVKNGSERLVVLNEVAQSVIDEQRGSDPEFVFTFRGRRIAWMHNTAW